ncbi:hypothetical protein MNBD_GAMMA12-2298 [hydrothermal vent metagenome]|uniref:Uncharacterized protein n=1 Tax=hydrothermal vent metagenome TaxID=652676 RepID=A0A3B0YQE8_9ZZZZ
MSREMLKAIMIDDYTKFDKLIQSKIDINELTEQEKWNYLHKAFLLVGKAPTSKMIRHLISCGIDVNAVDFYGNTPLHYAVRLKDTSLINVLLDVNVNVNHINKNGVSPLRESLASKPFNYESIELLIEFGADVEQKIRGGISIKCLAKIIAGEDEALMELLS